MSKRSDDLRWGRSTVDTACPLDCPDTCSLAVSVENGKIVRIDGSRRHDITEGYICAKVRRFGERVYGEDRLRYPAVRQGAKGEARFRRVTWDEALDRIARRMREIRDTCGAEAILPFSYGGSNGLISQDTADAQLFRRFGTSRLARTVCAAPTGLANRVLYGKMAGVTYADYRHARLIVIWGANPSSSGIHLVPHVRAAQRAGARLVVIDPRRTPLARHADLHLAVRPGTDLLVALSLHRYLFENELADERFLAAHTRGADRLRERAAPWTWERAAAEAEVDPRDLEQLADWYARLSPAVIRCGWGLERNRNGGHAALAVLALPAVAGKFGVRGGGYSMSNSGAWNFTAANWIGVDEPATRIVNMNHLGRALLEYDNPPVRMLFVYNGNPAATLPDQNRVLKGLKRDDLFTVVFEQVMTDTARYADVLLPATTFFETYDLARSYGLINLQMTQPVIEAVGESRPNVEVFSDLARRLDLEISETLATDSEALLHVTAAMPAEVREGLLTTGAASPPADGTPVQFVDVFPQTPDGKVDLFPAGLDVESPGGLYRYQPDPRSSSYPLALISPASEKTISSTLGELRTGPASLHIHPEDAGPRGLTTGAVARIFNDLGEIHCPVTVNPDVKPGTVSLPKGLWQKSTVNGSTANAVVSDALTDLGGGACFNDARVDVMRIVTAAFGDQKVALWTAADPRKVH
jgi:anaerobic selenocysteine-containing dehydrogenase